MRRAELEVDEKCIEGFNKFSTTADRQRHDLEEYRWLRARQNLADSAQAMAF